TVVVAAVVGLTIGVFAQGPRRDGLWDVKIEMEMPGMPAGMPPMTSQQCVTPADAKDPNKAMPPQGRGRGNGDGMVRDYKVDGNKVTWMMKCTGQTPMTGTGEFVYAADSYTGTMKMDMSGRGAVTMKYSGKRIGDCNK